ncbi:MAG: hypothetical protein AB7T22_13755 [Calditrichaceae bacterium]
MSKRKATEKEVETFLDEFRLRCRPLANPQVELEPRPVNMQFLLSKGLVISDVNRVILKDLTFKHYESGPEDDHCKNEYPGPVWIYKINKFRTTVYIKLKLYNGRFGPAAKCLSFHQ